MFPLFYSDAARGAKSPRRRPLQSLPGLDYDRFPEIVDVSELEDFGDMAGLFEMPFPVGIPYFDYAVLDMTVGDPDPPNKARYQAAIQLPEGDNFFYLESVYVDWPKQGTAAYPETNPTAAESASPFLQISSSDPRRRNARNAMQGPEMFQRPVRFDSINGQSIFDRGGNGFDMRRGFWFSPRDVVMITVTRGDSSEFPNWAFVGIAGRMVTRKFLQGVICEKR